MKFLELVKALIYIGYNIPRLWIKREYHRKQVKRLKNKRGKLWLSMYHKEYARRIDILFAKIKKEVRDVYK